ncbi:hypothetical protein YC2023_107391 [Brassica napus]
MATTTQTRSRRIVCSNNQLLYIRDDQRLVSWPCLGSNQHGGLRTPRRIGVSEEAEQRLRGDYMIVAHVMDLFTYGSDEEEVLKHEELP